MISLPKKSIPVYTFSQYDKIIGICSPNYVIKGKKCISMLDKLVSMTTLNVILERIPKKKFDTQVITPSGQTLPCIVHMSHEEYIKEIALYLRLMLKEHIEMLEQCATEWKNSLLHKSKTDHTCLYISNIGDFSGFYDGEVPSPEVLIGLLIQGHISFKIENISSL